MSNYGAPALSEGMQGPTFSKLGSQISAARSADVSLGSSLSGGQGMLILFSDMRDSLQTISDNTLETVSLLKDLVVGDVSQAKKDAIASGNTDPEPKEKGPGILSRVMGGLKSAFGALMPEKGGLMDTLLKLGLAVGGVALLKYFGDDMVPVLADLLKSIKEGKIGENIRLAYDYIKDIGLDAFEKIRDNTILFIDGAVKVKDFIVSAYKMVNDYIMSFDVGGKTIDLSKYGMGGGIPGARVKLGDGMLDPSEFDALKEDLLKKAVSAVGAIFAGVWDSFTTMIMSGKYFGSIATALLLYGPVAMIFGKGGGGAPGRSGMLRKVGIFGLLVYGLRTTWSSYNSAMRETLKNNDGNFVFSEFAANFLGGVGNAKGSALAAYNQALKGAGSGFLAGAAIGTVGLIPGVGTIIGGVFGAIAGGILGYLSGQAGTDKIKAIAEAIGSSVEGMIQQIGNFFQDIANGFKFLFTGRSFSKGFRSRSAGDVDEIQVEIDQQNAIIKQLQKMNDEEGGNNKDLLNAIREEESIRDNLIGKQEAAPTQSRINRMEELDSYKGRVERSYKWFLNRIYDDPNDKDGDGKRELNVKFARGAAKGTLNSAKGAAGFDAKALAAIGPDATNYDAFKYYERLHGPKGFGMDRQIYGMAQTFNNPKDAKMIDSINYAIDNDGDYQMGVNQINGKEITYHNGGFGKEGGGISVAADNSISNAISADTTIIHGDAKSFDGKMLHPLYGNYSFKLITD